MAKQRKFDYVFVIQGNYGHGWDDLDEQDTPKAARDSIKCYRDNEKNAAHRLIKRRVPHVAAAIQGWGTAASILSEAHEGCFDEA